MEKLPSEFKEKWVAALRSGDYKQGKDRLYNKKTDGFCCLGVACAILGVHKESLSTMRWIPTKTETELLVDYASLPNMLRGMAHNAESLASMNDNDTPFSEIADYIEENL